ncbi:DUF4326 domain-containing protein [Nocardia sp. CA-290969]|uniref:DUF4326 domain-containing protein n=1 Tax=Nocardia sp. CA-290969 TaxID=3239986 RepID=UPI003D93C7F1
MPQRIQLRRTKGWRLPDGAVVVARPSKWGNPYVLAGADRVRDQWGNFHYVAPGESRGLAVRLFRDDLAEGRLGYYLDDVVTELAGRDLGCWCPLGEPCHADVLLQIANREVP